MSPKADDGRPKTSVRLIIGGILLAVILIATSTRAEKPKIRQKKLSYEHHLYSDNIVPLEYDIELTMLDELPVTNVEGKVKLTMKITPARLWEPTKMDKIAETLHFPHWDDKLALDVHEHLEINDLELVESDSLESLREGKGKQLPIRTLGRFKSERIIVIPLDKGRYVDYYLQATIKYASKGPVSFYSGEMFDPSKQSNNKYHAARLNQAAASLLVPCYLEPLHKAEVSLTINQRDSDSRAVVGFLQEVEESGSVLSKSGASYKQSKFRSSNGPLTFHSLSFVIGPFIKSKPRTTSTTADANSVQVNFYEPVGHLGEGEFAKEFAVRTINWFTDKMKMRFPMKQINLAAVPAFDTWDLEILEANKLGYPSSRNLTDSLGIGLINEEHALISDSMSSPERRILAALNVAVAVARHWFGTAVTAFRMDDRWITEGLAFHLAIRAVRELEPDWGVDQFVGSHHRAQAFRDIIPETPSVLPTAGSSNGSMKSLRLSVESETVIDYLRANVVGDNNRFDDIVRRLVETKAENGISLNALSNAFATGELSAERVKEIIKTQRSDRNKRWLSVRWHDEMVIMALLGCFGRTEDGKKAAMRYTPLPVSLKLEFAKSASEKSHEVEISENVIFSSTLSFFRILDASDWFGEGADDSSAVDSGAWVKLKVSDNQVLPFQRVVYSITILPFLHAAIKTNKLSPAERIDLLRQQVDLMYMNQRPVHDTIIKYLENEQDHNVLLEMLRTIEIYEHTDPKHEVLLEKPLKDHYKRLGGLSTRNMDTKSLTEQRLISGLASMFIRRKDREVIEEAKTLFDSVRLDKLAAFQRDPVYLAIGQEGSQEQQQMLLDRLKVIGLPEERFRISTNLLSKLAST